MANGRVYCENNQDFYELAGSGGGTFTWPGWYEFDEKSDKWLWCTSRSLTDEEFEEHMRRQHAMLDRLEVEICRLRTEQLSLVAQMRERGLEDPR